MLTVKQAVETAYNNIELNQIRAQLNKKKAFGRMLGFRNQKLVLLKKGSALVALRDYYLQLVVLEQFLEFELIY